MHESSLLLDTHAWIWLAEGIPDKLSRSCLDRIRVAGREQRLLVSAISVWELGMLEAKGRVLLPMNIRDWVEEALSKPGLALAPLSPEIAIESSHLPGNLHGDPADRIIVATARVLGGTLLTRDRQLIAYSRQRHVRVLAA